MVNLWQWTDFERAWEEVRPLVSSPAWAFRLARLVTEERPGAKTANSILKRAFRSRPYFVLETGCGKVVGDWRDRYSRALAGDPESENGLAEAIIQRMQPGSFVDCGCNLGALSFGVGRRTGCLVFAVEPDAGVALRTAAGFALNGLCEAMLFVGAVGEQEGEIEFFSVPGQTESASVHSNNLGADAVSRKVAVTTVDAISQVTGKVGFLKVDVEGHEPAVLRGAEQCIRRDAPAILFEYHWGVAPQLGWQADDLKVLVDSWGSYRWSVLMEAEETQYPPRPELGLVANVLAVPG